ncbi:MAG: 50S ribosomal protein L19 [Puniceicoccales bacterium]|jgi:large subunit ribosomal protein L19|nr:50S ribosomal protein L19 [Puniceicoccales bacterium]
MSQDIIESVSGDQLKPDRHVFKVGDGVVVHTIVREGDKERVQLFSGIVIARHGSGISETFTVRRVVAGEGVERIFNINSPFVAKIEVERESVPMRAKLYYMRNRIGKSAMQVKEKRLLDAKK